MPARKHILLDMKHAKMLKRFASKIQVSESEVIRRALDSYNPARESEHETTGSLLTVLKDANERARTAVARAESELAETVAFQAHRQSRKTG